MVWCRHLKNKFAFGHIFDYKKSAFYFQKLQELQLCMQNACCSYQLKKRTKNFNLAAIFVGWYMYTCSKNDVISSVRKHCALELELGLAENTFSVKRIFEQV